MIITGQGLSFGCGMTNTASPLSVAKTDYWYVLPVTGQSNGMAYGEGLPLPATLDAPHPRIKQLARRSTVTPGGEACHYNDIIPLDHCPHDVQDMSRMNHPHADLSKGEYGTVAQAVHIAKKLLPYIPGNAGILIVPCCRGGSAFTQGADGAYNAASGATEASSRWGVGKPLYHDLTDRTKAALDSNPKNVLLAVVWMQGEFDMASAGYAQQPALFAAMVKQFRSDLADHAAQCPDFNAARVPWICGDTTYYWKNTYPTQYDVVYGSYKNSTEPGVHFVPFMVDENGMNTPTNEPAEDPDIPAAHYYGSASRTNGNMVSSLRGSHFSSWARRNIIPERLASAILLYAGRKTLLAAPSGNSQPQQQTPGGSTAGGTLNYSPQTDEMGYNGRRGDGTLTAQGWTTATGAAFSPVASPDNKGGYVLDIVKSAGKSWTVSQPVAGGIDLVKFGGRLTAKFRLTTALASNQYAFAFYLILPEASVPADITFAGKTDGGNPAVMSFFIQTDATSINLMQHKKVNTKLGTFGAYDQKWHTLEIVFPGNNSVNVTPVLDGVTGPAFDLSYSPANPATDTLLLTSITSGTTYGVQLEAFSVQVFRDDGTVILADTDASSYVYFPVNHNGGKVIIPDAAITAGNTVQIVADHAGTIAIQPASSNVLVNGLPSATTTDASLTLVQQGSDGKTWVVA
ncbi:sialate O-acetylesterase [Salmonella enterica]|nr:sialate O-acetylesterase [Salmonella enterica]ECH9653716.1 sialate O-acetylesterase [Salmonella enterica subsp. enterica serovar Miami]EDN5013871.1 sialate O-acetylesterase [Salmonella enterica subsp. enterica serovar Javiana]EAP4852724.1 sialate O-acetylesterase [Salmonella enterica]EAU5966815.1 sialate O-acetylesterase [Salmonella enterica]